jgi:hypothetical protein
MAAMRHMSSGGAAFRSLPTGRRRRFEECVSGRSRLAELLILCARIGFNP